MSFWLRWSLAANLMGFIGVWIDKGLENALLTLGTVALVVLFGLIVAMSSYATLHDRE